MPGHRHSSGCLVEQIYQTQIGQRGQTYGALFQPLPSSLAEVDCMQNRATDSPSIVVSGVRYLDVIVGCSWKQSYTRFVCLGPMLLRPLAQGWHTKLSSKDQGSGQRNLALKASRAPYCKSKSHIHAPVLLPRYPFRGRAHDHPHVWCPCIPYQNLAAVQFEYVWACGLAAFSTKRTRVVDTSSLS